MIEGKFELLASNILKMELMRRGLKYPDLVEKLKIMGITYSVDSIRQKLSKGAFSFSFALECFKAIGIKNLNLADYFEGNS